MSEKLPDGWTEMTIGETCEILDSKRIPLNSSQRAIRQGIYPYYGANGIQDHIDDYIFDGEAILLAEDGGNFEQYSTRPIAQFVRGKYWVNNHAHIFRAMIKNNNRYIYYSLVHKNITKFINGGTRSKLNQSDLRDIPVLLPPLAEQKKIAEILTSVDDVIENTQAQIDKLQDLKKATMNELLTKGIGHTEFKDSALGRIPKSWEVHTLDKVCNISRGKFSHRPRNDPDFYHGNYPFLQTGDIPSTNTDIVSYTQSLNDNGILVSKKFASGTIVMTIAATIGEVGILTFDSYFPDSLVGINCDDNHLLPYYLLYYLRQMKPKLINEAPESAQKNLNLQILNHFLIKVPTICEQKNIAKKINGIDIYLLQEYEKLTQIQSLKKALMNDLLTGKVRVN